MSRRNLLLLLLAVLLVGVYFLVDPGAGEAEKRPTIRPFGALREEGAAREILISGPSPGRVRLTREEYRWHLSEPIRAPADSAVVEQLLTLAQSIVLEQMDIPVEDLESYGLLPTDRLEVRITLVSGDASTLYLGRKMPLDVIHTYTQIPGKETLYRTLSDHRALLSQDIDSLVDSRVLPVEEIAPNRLVIETATERIEITRRDNEFFLFPGELHRADETRVVEVTRRLKETRFRRSELTTDTLSATEGAILPGFAWLTFEMSTGEGIVLRLPVSSEGPEEGGSSSLWPEHTLVLAETFRLPELSRQTFVDRRLLPLSPGEVSSIEMGYPEGGVLLRREDSGWSVFRADHEGAGMPGDPEVIAGAIRSLGSLRGEAFVGRAPIPGVEPLVTLEAVTLDGEEHSVAIFEDEGGGYLAETTRYRSALVVTPEAVGTLLMEPGFFANKALVVFDLPAVSRIDIRQDGRRFRISRDAGGDWYLQRPGRRLLETPRLVAFLFALRDLEHTGETATPQVTAPRNAGPGVQAPGLRVTLEGLDGEIISWLSLRGETAESDRFEGSYDVPAELRAPIYDFVEGLGGEVSAGR